MQKKKKKGHIGWLFVGVLGFTKNFPGGGSGGGKEYRAAKKREKAGRKKQKKRGGRNIIDGDCNKEKGVGVHKLVINKGESSWATHPIGKRGKKRG